MESYVKFYDNLKVNLIKIEQGNLPDNLQQAMENRKTFNASTLLYNDFTTMVDAFYFVPHNKFSSTFCSIYRKSYSQPYYDYICKLEGEIALKDYNICNNDNYEYLAVIASGQSGGAYTYQIYSNRNDKGDKIYTPVKWDSWSICNIEETENFEKFKIFAKTGDTWLLGLNLEGENLVQNLGISSWDTLGRYPKVAISQKNYESSTFTGLLGRMKQLKEVRSKDNYNGGKCTVQNEIVESYRYTERINLKSEYGREVEKYQAWKEFCSDGELKLLKDVKGNAWIVQIVDMPNNSINNSAYAMPTTISFSWKEVLNASGHSVVDIITTPESIIATEGD